MVAETVDNKLGELVGCVVRDNIEALESVEKLEDSDACIVGVIVGEGDLEVTWEVAAFGLLVFVELFVSDGLRDTDGLVLSELLKESTECDWLLVFDSSYGSVFDCTGDTRARVGSR